MKALDTNTNKESFSLRFLYHTFAGRIILKILTHPIISVSAGAFLKTPLSKMWINKFIKKNQIDMNLYRETHYNSFNDFFIRDLKEKKDFKEYQEHLLLSPCDGKVSAYAISKESNFYIKNSVYSIKDLIEDESAAEDFIGGTCVIFRLTPDDYHRYLYIDDGNILTQKKIKGVLHTVRPIAHNRYPVFVQNSRVCTVMNTRNFDEVIQIEVGALMVGKIKNHKSSGAFNRGEEKGYFEFGGSTIILLFKENSVKIDENLLKVTEQGKEAILRVGNIIGEKI